MTKALTPSEKRSALRNIVIRHPRRDHLEVAVSQLIEDTRDVIHTNMMLIEAAAPAGADTSEDWLGLRNRSKSVVLDELWLLPVIGPSGATKTTSVKAIVNAINLDPNLPKDEMPVLYVKLHETSRTPKALQVQILEAFGDPGSRIVDRAQRVSADIVNRNIVRIAREKKTVLLVIDEAHTVLVGRQSNTAKMVGNLLKSLLNEGAFSIVLMGTDQIHPILKYPELKSRTLPFVDFGAFRLDDTAGLQLFFWMVATLEDEMLEAGIISQPLNLIATVTNQAIVYDMTGGVFGTLCRILGHALRVQQVDPEEKPLGWSHIEEGLDRWNLERREQHENLGKNPFSKGAAKTVKALENQLGAITREPDVAERKAGGSRRSAAA